MQRTGLVITLSFLALLTTTITALEANDEQLVPENVAGTAIDAESSANVNDLATDEARYRRAYRRGYGGGGVYYKSKGYSSSGGYVNGGFSRGGFVGSGFGGGAYTYPGYSAYTAYPAYSAYYNYLPTYATYPAFGYSGVGVGGGFGYNSGYSSGSYYRSGYKSKGYGRGHSFRG